MCQQATLQASAYHQSISENNASYKQKSLAFALKLG
jgi:hypothetical protein